MTEIGGFNGIVAEKSLIIRPLAGLANRLRALASAEISARYAGRILYLDWLANDDCGANWNELFENEIPVFPGPLPSKVRVYDKEYYDFIFSGAGNLADDNEDTILVKTYFNFKPRKMSMRDYLKQKARFYQRLVPVSRIRERLDELQEKYFDKGPVIGVHIRRRDLVIAGDPSRYISPTSLFMERMSQLAVSQPDATFFLSTDDREDENHIIDAFPGRVFTNPKIEVSRDTKEGMRDAVVDWLALSRTRLILRSVGTSFSKEAAVLGGMPWEVIKKPLWPCTRRRFWMKYFKKEMSKAKRRFLGRLTPS